VFSVCVPNARLVVLKVSVCVTALSCSANTAVPPAVSVAVCVVVTAAAVAVKLAVVAPAATVTEDGTVTAVSLLVRATLWPPDAAAPASVTVHASVAAPVSDALEQVSPVTACVDAEDPVPDSPTLVFLELFLEVLPATAALTVVPLLVTVSVPLEAPCALGAKLICAVMLAPAARFTGSVVLLESAYPVPATVRSVTDTGVVPGFVMVTVDCAVVPTGTDPNATASGVVETVASLAAVVVLFTT
jgi:hypothetical protein